MSLDIRGVWKYQDLLKEYSELQARASKAMLRTGLERDAAYEECQRLAMEVDRQRTEKKAAREEIKRLEKEIERLKKVKYRWDTRARCWWPVEGTNIYDMVQKVPYVPLITPKQEEGTK